MKFSSPSLWTVAFSAATYLMATACVLGGVRRALILERSSEPLVRKWAATWQLLVFALLVFLFYGLESFAHTRAPYYIYSDTFRDLVPRIRFDELIPALKDSLTPNTCTKLVTKFEVGIPLTIPLLEASLTYAAIWTARLLGGKLWAQPIFAGLVLLLVDALLDPVVAAGRRCDGSFWPATGNGLGLWHWLLPTPDDLSPGECNVLGTYFHIPFYNYAAWLGAPIVAASLINLIGPFGRSWVHPQVSNLLARARSRSTRLVPKEGWQGVGLLVNLLVPAVVAVLFIIETAPAKIAQDLSPEAQARAMLVSVGVAFAIVIHQFGSLATQDRVDATLTTPVSLALLIPSVAGLLGGQFVDNPWLMPVAGISLFWGLWLMWLPYREALSRFSKKLGEVDTFVRLHYFGFTALLILLGAALFDDRPSNLTVYGLLVIAACFHVYSYVANDVIDFELDRTQPLRKDDPLHSGAITKHTASGIAVACIPAAVLMTLYIVKFRGVASRYCLGVLAVAFAFMLIYNIWGKKCAFPPLTDLIQGVAWGSLAFVGGLVVNAVRESPSSISNVFARCAVVAVYGAGFIFLINGIHGGLRDLANDGAMGKKTTALFLGAKVDRDGQVRSNWKVALFAHVVHLALFADLAIFVARETRDEISLAVEGIPLATRAGEFSDENQLLLVGIGLVVLFVLSVGVLHGVVKEVSPHRNAYVSWHILVVLLPPIAVFCLAPTPALVFKIAVVLTFAVPLVARKIYLDRLIAIIYEDGGVRGSITSTVHTIGARIYKRARRTPLPEPTSRVKTRVRKKQHAQAGAQDSRDSDQKADTHDPEENADSCASEADDDSESRPPHNAA